MRSHLVSLSLVAVLAAAGIVPIESSALAEPEAAVDAAVAAPVTVPVAILPFQDRGGEADRQRPGAAGDGGRVTDLLFAELVADPDLVLIEREEIRKLLDEQELQLSGLANPAEANRVGQLTGAKMLITGSVIRADNSLYVVAKIIGTETSRVLGASVKGTPRDDLGKLAGGLAEEIRKVLAARGGEILPKSATREDRLAALVKKIGAGEKPTLWVQIAEQHVAPAVVIAAGNVRVVIDPAAETEMTLFARESGFTLVDPAEGKRSNAAILVKGEAISETATRHGNLVSAKARLEVKAIDQATGEVLAVDRQTTVATDLSEQIAAKTALQEASAAVAERLLPKIAGFKKAEAKK